MIGAVAQDLLRKLLVKDPHKRLGSGPRRAEDIKTHAFFKVLVFTPALSLGPSHSLSLSSNCHTHTLSPYSFHCSIFIGSQLVRPGWEEGNQPVQTRDQEWAGYRKLCWGVHWHESSLLSSQHPTKHWSTVPGTPYTLPSAICRIPTLCLHCHRKTPFDSPSTNKTILIMVGDYNTVLSTSMDHEGNHSTNYHHRALN